MVDASIDDVAETAEADRSTASRAFLKTEAVHRVAPELMLRVPPMGVELETLRPLRSVQVPIDRCPAAIAGLGSIAIGLGETLIVGADPGHVVLEQPLLVRSSTQKLIA